MSELYCNNCGKIGHLYSQCKMPITSIGFVTFRVYNNTIQYLMIRRKDTLGFIDFMRGKYSIYNKGYIMNMLNQMTKQEKEMLMHNDFYFLWTKVWGKERVNTQYKTEETSSQEKFSLLKNGIYINGEKAYTLNDLIIESNQSSGWDEAEWGFPKGRRNFQEKDFECAIREFKEETGIDSKYLFNIQNILPFEEIFTGSNYKSYKHKYYLAYCRDSQDINMSQYQKSEVSKMEWFSYDECVKLIRNYNLEKKRILSKIHNTIQNNRLFYC